MSPGCPENLILVVTVISLGGYMEEVAFRQQKEESERQMIDHLCSTAFQELGPKGVWCPGRSSGLRPRTSMQGVCVWDEAAVWQPAFPGPFPYTLAFPSPFLSPLACLPYPSPLPSKVGTAAENQILVPRHLWCTYCFGATLPQKPIPEWAGRKARGQELQEVGVSLQRPGWIIW